MAAAAAAEEDVGGGPLALLAGIAVVAVLVLPGSSSSTTVGAGGGGGAEAVPSAAEYVSRPSSALLFVSPLLDATIASFSLKDDDDDDDEDDDDVRPGGEGADLVAFSVAIRTDDASGVIFVAGGGGGGDGEVSVRSMVDLCDAGETGAFLGPPSDDDADDGMISASMAADGVMMFSSTDVNILILVWRFAFFSFDLRLLEEEE